MSQRDRLSPSWVATLALLQKSRTIRFDSAPQTLDFFHLPKDGPRYRRIVKGFQRVFAATIFFGIEQQPHGVHMMDLARFQSFDQMQLWFNASADHPPDIAENLENTIVLSEAFYREINEHRIPVERDVVAALAHAPGVLDFYVWLVWKSWTVHGRPAAIPIVAEYGLNKQLGSAEYAESRLFRVKIRNWLKQVKLLGPDCPAVLSSDGQLPDRWLLTQISGYPGCEPLKFYVIPTSGLFRVECRRLPSRPVVTPFCDFHSRNNPVLH